MVFGKIVIVILCFVVATYFINNLDVFTEHTNVSQSPAQVGVCVLGVLLSCAVALVVCWTMRKGKDGI